MTLLPPALSEPIAPDPVSALPLQRLRVWDLPTRLFHWALALAVTGLLVTGFNGIMEWHFRLGYAALALLLFRFAWGLVGGHWSRFASFAHGPAALLAYLRGRTGPAHSTGHTPLGSLSVFAFFLLLSLQVASGLVADDEIMAAGPLTRFVSGDWVARATGWHAEYGKWLVLALVVLHVLAVLVYVLWRRRPLVRPMLHGDKHLPPTVPPLPHSRDDLGSRFTALLIFALCVALSVWVASLRA